MSDADDEKFFGHLRSLGGQGQNNSASGNYLMDAGKGVLHGAADLGYGAMSTLFPTGPSETSNILNPTYYVDKYAPGVKKYVDEPVGQNVEGAAREATDIFGPLAIPGGGEIEEGVNLAARAIPGAMSQGSRIAQALGRPIASAAKRAPLLGEKALKRVERYVAPTVSGAYKGFVGGSMQPSRSGDQAQQGEIGATAGATRAALGTLPWQVKYGLPALAILWEESQRLAGGRGGGLGSLYGLWHIPSALGALAGLANPASSGAAAAQLYDKYRADNDQPKQAPWDEPSQ